MEATIRLREMFRTTALGWRGLAALQSLTLELASDSEARTVGEQARPALAGSADACFVNMALGGRVARCTEIASRRQHQRRWYTYIWSHVLALEVEQAGDVVIILGA